MLRESFCGAPVGTEQQKDPPRRISRLTFFSVKPTALTDHGEWRYGGVRDITSPPIAIIAHAKSQKGAHAEGRSVALGDTPKRAEDPERIADLAAAWPRILPRRAWSTVSATFPWHPSAPDRHLMARALAALVTPKDIIEYT
jgi:hypothetical protein